MRKSSIAWLTFLLLFSRNLPADLPPVATKTLQLPGGIFDFAWDATRSRFFASAGTTIFQIDPETASVESSWALANTASQIAVSADGQFLYASISTLGVIRRYRLNDRTLDLEISLGTGDISSWPTGVTMVVLPNQPQSILVAIPPGKIVIYDGATPRSNTLALNITSLYVRPSDHALFGWGNGQIFSLTADANGINATRTVPFAAYNGFSWSGNYETDFEGNVFDLSAGVLIGRAGFPQSTAYHYPAIADPAGRSVVVAEGDGDNAWLVRYSLTTFRPIASAALTREQMSDMGVGNFGARAKGWGSDGIAIQGLGLVFLHVSAIAPIATPPLPKPTIDATGVIHVPLPANGLAFDQSRNRLWATIPGYVPGFGNTVMGIDAGTGNVVDVMEAGSEPGQVVLSGDGSHLFAALQGAPAVSTFDLQATQPGPRISTMDTTGPVPVYLAPASVSAIPHQADSVAVLRAKGLFGNDPNPIRSLVIFDSGVQRKQAYTGPIDAIYPGDSVDSFYAATLGSQYGTGAHDVYQLRFDSQGVTFDKQLNPLQLGQTGLLVYSNGTLFTGAGQDISPDTNTINGTFSSGGIPVPFRDHNLVAFVQGALPTSNLSTLTTFDWNTLRPLASFSLTASIYAAARSGDRVIAVAAGSEILLIPFSVMTSWPVFSGKMTSVAPGLQSVSVPVSAMDGVPGTNKLVLALPSTAGSIGNGIAILDTDTGKIESSGFIGSEPSLLRTSADGSTAYAYLAGEYRVGRFNIASASRDLHFAADPTGGSTQYGVVDMALGPDGALTVSLEGGWLATFDHGVVRPQVDKNTQGPGAYSGAPYQIALNTAGTTVYAYDGYWSFEDSKREAINAKGIQWLSGTLGLVGNAEFKYAQGLLYLSNGSVVDPERSRVVGYFPIPLGASAHVAPDLAASRIYVIAGGQIMIYDSHSYAQLANWSIPNGYQLVPADLVRFGSDGLAFHTSDRHLYLVKISAIPLLAAPVPTPQPSLPSTPGVTVVDIATKDLAYDSARNLIYGTVPNREAANGDHIIALDPKSGSITARWSTNINPNVMALSDDQNHLYFSSGQNNLGFFSGFSPTSEEIRDFDLTTHASGSGFPSYPSAPDFSYSILDLAILHGLDKSVAVIDDLSESAGGGVGNAPYSLRVFDSGSPRQEYLRPHTFTCRDLVSGATPERLYCSSGDAVWRLAVNSDGVTVLDSVPLLPGRGDFGHMVFQYGRLFTTTGVVIDPEAGNVIGRVDAQGPVAVHGNLAYWIDPSTFSNTPYVTLRVFDVSTLQPVRTKQINVTSNDVSRLVACSGGRVAFRAGNEIYIVNP